VLEAAVLDHLTAHQTAYEASLWTPKFHYSLHLADQLRQHRCLVSCFVHERKHKSIKAAGVPRVNTTSYDIGVLEDVTVQHLWDLATPLASGDGLREPRDPPRKMVEAVRQGLLVPMANSLKTSSVCMCNGRAVAVGDVAMVIGSADPVEVWFHVAADGVCYTCISPWPVTGAHARHRAARMYVAPRFVKSAMLADSVVYYRGATECTVLVPPHLR
jgi:hypothetical protein